MALTRSQRVALGWIRDFPCVQSEWRRDGKAAFGPPNKWNQMRLSGPRGSIVIDSPDWDIIRRYFKPPEIVPGKIYLLNDEGLSLLESEALNRAEPLP